MIALMQGEANPRSGVDYEPFNINKHASDLAQMSYRMADAMLAERAKRKTGVS
jgi:hypothetical protein